MRIPSRWVMAVSGCARIICLLAAAAALTACSAIKLTYNNIDDVAYWWLDSYIDFTDDQAADARAELGRLHRWHRRTELLQVAATLQSMEQLAAGEVSPAQACAFEPRLRQHLDALLQQAEPVAVKFARSLEPEQLTHLERKFARVDRDFEKDWVRLSPVALKEKRLEQMFDRAESVYGKLQERQRSVLEAEVAKSVFDARKSLAERRRRQQDLLQQLRTIASAAASSTAADAQALLHGYVQRVQQSPDPAYRPYQRALIDESCAAFSALHNSTTPPQREAAARKLRAWQRDLKELAAQQ